MDSKECAICYKNLGNIYRTLHCGHKFHHKCLIVNEKYNNSQCICPYCRQTYENIKLRDRTYKLSIEEEKKNEKDDSEKKDDESEKKGFEVIQAEGVQKGIDTVKAKKPGFAVVDLRLADGNGLEVVKQIQFSKQRYFENYDFEN